MIPRDSIRVTTGATSVRNVMAEAVVEFRFRHPRADLRISTAASSRECVEALVRGEADLAWITLPDPGPGLRPGVEQVPVLELPWVLAMRAGEIYADRAWVEVAELSGLSLVRLPEESISGARLAAALANVTLADDAGAGDWDTALLLAELGVGHAVVPRLPGPPPGDTALRLVPLRGLAPLAVGWASRAGDVPGPAARAFAETVSRSCRMRAVYQG
jgi:DNA-binding transcriptional LysR family regulator